MRGAEVALPVLERLVDDAQLDHQLGGSAFDAGQMEICALSNLFRALQQGFSEIGIAVAWPFACVQSSSHITCTSVVPTARSSSLVHRLRSGDRPGQRSGRQRRGWSRGVFPSPCRRGAKVAGRGVLGRLFSGSRLTGSALWFRFGAVRHGRGYRVGQALRA